MGQKSGGLCLLAALGAIGCGSTSAVPPPTPEDDADFVSCAAETRATPYTAGMSETSIAGSWTVKLLKNTYVLNGKSLSEAPAKGTDTWTIEIDDASGQPTDSVLNGVSPWMPDHQHGTTAVNGVGIGAGKYTLPIYFYMAGYWEVTINLSSAGDAGSAMDSAMFPICVPD